MKGIESDVNVCVCMCVCVCARVCEQTNRCALARDAWICLHAYFSVQTYTFPQILNTCTHLHTQQPSLPPDTLATRVEHFIATKVARAQLHGRSLAFNRLAARAHALLPHTHLCRDHRPITVDQQVDGLYGVQEHLEDGSGCQSSVCMSAGVLG